MTKEEAVVDLKINNQEAVNRMDELETKAKKLRKEFADAYGKGNQEEVRRINKELQTVNKEMERQRTNAGNIAAAMKSLDKATPRELQKTIKAINAELNSGRVIRGSKEWDAYIAKLKEVNAELKKVQEEQKEMEGFWSRMKNKFNDWGAMIATGMAGMAGLVMTGRSAVQAYADMEQEEASVRKYTGMTADEVERLNEEFKKMDTRTSREQLNKLAQDAGRLGKSSHEDVLGFVRAADHINVVLEDLGDGATLTLSKLTGIFGQEQIYGTEQSLLKVGSVINELSQNCTASAPYLAEFASRMGGVAAQSRLTIQEVMAFGAVLDANNQKVEASSTALSQVMVRLFRDPAKYAKVAGLDVKEFSELVKTDMNEALLTLLEALNKVGGMDKLSPMFKDMGENGARAITALSTLAGHIDEVRAQQIEANKAFEEGTSVTKEFEVQNNTVQAKLEKTKKRFKEIAISLGKELLPVMQYCITGMSMMIRTLKTIIDFVKGNYRPIVILTSTIVAYWTATKVANNWTLILSKAMNAMRGIAIKATGAFKALVTVVKTNPIGIATAAFTALVTTLTIAKDKSDELKDSFKKMVEEIDREAKTSTATEISLLDKLYQKTQDTTVATEERRKAIDKLREIYPSYFKNLTDEEILVGKAKTAYEELKTQILESAKAKGRNNIIAKLEEEIQDLTSKWNDEAIRWIGIKLEYSQKEQLNPGRGDVAQYRLAINNLEILEKKYGDKIDELKAKQDSLANLNAESKLKEPMIQEYENSVEGQKNNSSEGLSGKELKKLRKLQSAELKAALKEQEAIRDRALAGNLAAYSAGLKNYKDYVAEKQDIEKQYFIGLKSVYETRELQDTEDYAGVLKKEEEMLANHLQTNRQMAAEEVDRAHQLRVDEITKSFYDINSVMCQNQKALDQAMLEEDMRYLEEKQKLYEIGSKEYADIALQIEDRLRRDQLEKQKELMKYLEEYREKFANARAKKEYDEEVRKLKELFAANLITQEEYEKALSKLREQNRTKNYSDTLKVFDKIITRLEKMGYAAEGAGDKLAELFGAVSEEDMTKFMEAFEKFANDGAFGTMMTNTLDAVTNLWEGIQNISEEGASGMAKHLQSVAENIGAFVGAIQSTFSGLWQAERDLELAEIEKHYDTEIDRAGKNSKKVAALEEEKEKEIAKMKNKYNKREMQMQIAQAIAQTASNALGAYGAMVKIPVVGPALAAAAAAAATAAGMIQIATIKKQHEAEAMGYYAGGFTTKDADNRKEVGVVHANEFVANHKAVKNPNITPVLRLIDYAQKNNTIASLTRDDVSHALGLTRGVSARGESGPQEIVIQPADDKQITTALNRNAKTIEVLNETLADGIKAVVVLSGENGLDNQYRKFNRLKNNPKR